jgi:multisubunit Na+/H+ antiporter MnhB subunit
MFYGESYHIVVVLEANPQAYIGYVEGAALGGALPIAASLALFSIAYLKGRRTSTDSLRNWLLIILGGFSLLWGSLYLHASYTSYSNAVSTAHGLDITNVDGFLLAIYATYGLAAILWLTTGLLFIAMSAYLLQVK